MKLIRKMKTELKVNTCIKLTGQKDKYHIVCSKFIEFAGNTDSEFEARIAGSKKWTFLTR